MKKSARCSRLLVLRGLDGRPGRTRTCNRRIRNPMLYPLELRARTQFDCTLRLPPVKPDYLAALYYPTDGRFVSSSSSRLAYIDWMRGLACVLMFQTHCYDSWLGGGAR